MSVQRGGEGTCHLYRSAWLAVGKTGLIIFVIVLCTLGGCQHPTAACTDLDKNNCKRGPSLSLRRRREELLQSNGWIWFFISGSLYLLPRKHWLYLQSEFFSCLFRRSCCLHLRTFCLECCPTIAENEQIPMTALKPFSCERWCWCCSAHQYYSSNSFSWQLYVRPLSELWSWGSSCR